MLDAALVAVDELAAEVTIDLVEVQAVVAAEQGLHKLNVLANLVDGAGAAGIVTSGLDTAREGFIALETDDVIGLPAVE